MFTTAFDYLNNHAPVPSPIDTGIPFLAIETTVPKLPRPDFCNSNKRSRTVSQVTRPKPCCPVETNRHMCINPGPSTDAHGNQNEDHRRPVYESEKSARKKRSLVSADSAAATTASEDLKAQTRNCRRRLSFACRNTSESACALREYG